jgi:hypothetical protein
MKKLLCVLAAAAIASAPLCAQTVAPQAATPATTEAAPVAALDAVPTLDATAGSQAPGVGSGALLGLGFLGAGGLIAAALILVVGLQQTRTSVTHK